MLQMHTFNSWLPPIVIFLLTLAYWYGWFTLRRRQKIIRIPHAISFTVGMLLLSIAYLPEMMHWGHADMRGHMVQHLLMAMYAPVFLVLGAPSTLLLQILPAPIARRLTSILKSSFFRMISHPVTAMLLNIGGMYLLYLSPLYNQMHHQPFLHHLVHLHFLLAGYLFTWSMIGIDPGGHKVSFRLRLSVLFISIAAHAFLSKAMYAYTWPKQSIHSDQQIQEGARLMYYWGDLSELILLIIFFSMWYKSRNDSFKSVPV
ncbi:cytochrome c oxidase assembly protein [Marivirga sp. S37H4]|uniref:Cytochrome c oxidase assembly protein n=1 Tax=Marivirga aurantiaca TaxID=2802615 RepID=A0A935CAH0_9BACT|nr:cytochrome c oxidase assembly protein [Marivirga aurantiaca]MBK6266590.1 cytochrome c oxidase assembly protein [Marivirga aurantiaca]